MNEKRGMATPHPYRFAAILGIVVLGVIGLAWMAAFAPVANAAGDSIVVIVNKANPVENLSMADLKKLIFPIAAGGTQEMRWRQ